MREIRYIQAMNEALSEEMERDENIFIIGEDVQAGTFGASRGLVQKFGPERIMDTPLSETAVAGAAIGAAMCGLRPVADIMFGDFMFIAGNEIINNAAKWHFIHGDKIDLPLVILACIGGGARLGPEHSQSPESVFWHTSGLKVVIPTDPYSVKGLLKTSIRDNNPVIFFYHKRLLGVKGDVPEEEYTVPFGVADIKREGTDVTVIAVSNMVQLSLQVAEELKEKVSVEVIDPRTLEPFDIDTIVESVKKTGRVVIVDEDAKRCGVTAEIGMQIMERAFDSLDAPIERVASADLPIAGAYMEQYIIPQPKDIVAAIEKIMA